MSSATAIYPLPDAAIMRELLGMLFDGLQVKPRVKLEVSPKFSLYFGVYVANDGTPGALCICDLAFAANAGAALSMLPPNTASAAIKARELSDLMLANLREVMNICTRLVLHDGTPHLRLAQVGQHRDLSAQAAAIAAAPRGRIDFEIGIGKYGSGALAVLTL